MIFPSLQELNLPHVLVAQLCLTLCDPMDCSLPGSFVHGILQAKILAWVAIPFPRASSQPRDWSQVSHIAGRFFTFWASRKTHFLPTWCQRQYPQISWLNKCQFLQVDSEAASTLWSQITWLCYSVLTQDVVLEPKRKDMDVLTAWSFWKYAHSFLGFDR